MCPSLLRVAAQFEMGRVHSLCPCMLKTKQACFPLDSPGEGANK